MGCLCPRTVPYVAPNTYKKDASLNPQAVTHQDFMVQSQRKQILPAPTPKSNLSKLDMFSKVNSPYPTERFTENKYDQTASKGASGKSTLSGIIISQLGGSKLQRTISIISTEADIASLNQSMSSNQSMAQEMVVVSKEFHAKQKLKKIHKRYYSLIESKLYVKKDTTTITKIRSPISQSSLFCSLQTIRQTIHLTDGIPIENIKILTTEPLAYLVEDNFPLVINATLECTSCKAKKLKSSSSCKLKYNIQCKCGSNQFNILNITTSPIKIPIWYDRQKINSNAVSYSSNNELRAIGCNICWKFQTCAPMACGCLRCSMCSYQHSTDKCILCL